MQTYKVAGVVKFTNKPTEIEVKAESQAAAEAYVAEVCPTITVKPTTAEAPQE